MMGPWIYVSKVKLLISRAEENNNINTTNNERGRSENESSNQKNMKICTILSRRVL